MNETRVVIIKNGVAKELHNLPGEIMAQLEKAYDAEPIRGMSRETFEALGWFFWKKLEAYEEKLESGDCKAFDMFEKSMAFADAFDISYQESPAFFDMMMLIERSISERECFDSKSINMRNIKSMINKDWFAANKDFRNWARRLFEETGLKIGIIRMSKFFYGVITGLQVA